MNWLVYHIVSGQAYFSGGILLLVAAVVSARQHRMAQRVSVLLAFLGSLAVAISATPVSNGVYAVGAVVMLVWLIAQAKTVAPRWPIYGLILWCVVAMALETPWLFSTPLVSARERSVAIIGDSVTAGVDGDETSERWPDLLARKHNILVHDISHIGETAGSAEKRVKVSAIQAPVVIVEIGGNDLLGDTTPLEFSTDLDALLSSLVAPGRQILMFELPLPPFCNEYGRIQRKLAHQHGVILAPKRYFLSVIAGGDSTLDSIHLSQQGHEHMAENVWTLIRDAFPDE